MTTRPFYYNFILLPRFLGMIGLIIGLCVGLKPGVIQPAYSAPALAPLCGATVTTINGGNISSNTTWTTANVYVLNGDVYINSGITLTIQPGVVIKARTNARLFVNGRLVADGTTTNPVYFTSYLDDTLCGDTNGDGAATQPASGNWGHVQFGSTSDPTSVIRRAVFRYGGSSGGSTNGPIILANATATFDNISFSDNRRNAVEIGATTWTTKTLGSTTVMFWLVGNSYLQNANTLTFIPGTKVKGTTNARWFIDGKLVADGTQAAPITFTSDRDDTVCGVGANDEAVCDTNNDLAATTPAAGNWGYLQFGSTSDPTSVIRRAVFRYGGGWGGSASNGPIILANATATFDNISFSGNARNGVEISATTWTTKTLGSTTVMFWLRGDNYLLSGQTLTFIPGTKVKGTTNARWFIDGKLVADGTQAAPITFTSDRDDTVCGTGVNGEAVCDTNNDLAATTPAAGNWGYLQFGSTSDPTSVIRRAVFRYGGSSGGSTNGPIILANATATFDNISFSDNRRNAVEIGTTTWTTKTLGSTTVMFWFIGDRYLQSGQTLTFIPGTKVKGTTNARWFIDGKLTADGTQAAPIVFTSERDDTVCGVGANDEAVCDTNNDLAATTPAAGNWGYLQFNSTSDPTSVIRRAVFRYGNRGIVLNNATPTIAYSLFKTNTRGLEFAVSSQPSLTCNDFENNTDYGLYNNQPGTPVTAQQQWWNHPSGPTHATNPNGVGDRVSNGVNFTPWYGQPCSHEIQTFSITGQVRTAANNPVAGVTISAGPGGSATTNASGVYTLTGLITGTYTFTPTFSGYTFAPITRTTNVPPNRTGQDFTATPPSVSAPTSLAASAASQAQINLTWTDNSTDETNFRLERSANGTSGWTEIATIAANTTGYNNTGLTCNTIYYYRIRAYRQGDGQFSTYSNIANATTQACPPPPAPSNLAASAASQTQINLTWTDNSSDETNFRLERSANGTSGWTEIATIGANSTSTNNTGLACGTVYYYRIRAYRQGDGLFSGYSNVANATTQACPPPNTPTNLAASAASQTQINLTWTDNSSDETNFRLERSANGTSGWTEIATIGANSTGTNNTGLACGTVYYYRIRAYRQSDGQFSGYSNTANATTQACPPPNAPTSLAASATSQTQINLTWTDNSSDETNFRLERSANGTSGWTEIATIAVNSTSTNNTGLACGTVYYYRIRAYRQSDGQFSGYSNIANAVTQNCISSGYSISGRITNPYGNPLANVILTTQNGVSTITGAGGDYTFTNLLTATYTFTPTLNGYTFAPASRIISVPPDAAEQNFVAIPQNDQAVVPYMTGYRYKIVAHDAEAGFEQPGFDDSDFALGNAGFGTSTGGCSLNNPTDVQTIWPLDTDILLRKEFFLPPNAGNLRVSVAIDNDVQVFINGHDISNGLQTHDGCPTRGDLVFSAPDNILNSGVNLLAARGRDRGTVSFLDLEITVDFNPLPFNYTISGRVTDETNTALSNVTITAGNGLTATTNANGDYTFTNLITGTYTLSPILSSYTFTPTSRIVNVPPSRTGQDFVRHPLGDIPQQKVYLPIVLK